jgi:hypothetical protein
MYPHVESLLSYYLSTMQLYNVWLTELAGHAAMVQTHTRMRDTWAGWCGGTHAIPPAILKSLNDYAIRANSAMRECFERRHKVKELLAAVQNDIQECLQDQTLSPYERTLLVHCATSLLHCDPDHPPFPLGMEYTS